MLLYKDLMTALLSFFPAGLVHRKETQNALRCKFADAKKFQLHDNRSPTISSRQRSKIFMRDNVAVLIREKHTWNANCPNDPQAYYFFHLGQAAYNYYITNRSIPIRSRFNLDEFARGDKTRKMHRSCYFRHPREPFFARGMHLHITSVGNFTLYC